MFDAPFIRNPRSFHSVDCLLKVYKAQNVEIAIAVTTQTRHNLTRIRALWRPVILCCLLFTRLNSLNLLTPVLLALFQLQLFLQQWLFLVWLTIMVDCLSMSIDRGWSNILHACVHPWFHEWLWTRFIKPRLWLSIDVILTNYKNVCVASDWTITEQLCDWLQWTKRSVSCQQPSCTTLDWFN